MRATPRPFIEPVEIEWKPPPRAPRPPDLHSIECECAACQEINAKFVDQVREVNTYELIMECQNCGELQPAQIPKGVRWDSYHGLCRKCGGDEWWKHSTQKRTVGE